MMRPHLPDTCIFPLALNVSFTANDERDLVKVIQSEEFSEITIFVTEGGLLGFKFKENSDFFGGAVDVLPLPQNTEELLIDPVMEAKSKRRNIALKRVRLANAISLLISSVVEKTQNRPIVRHYVMNAFNVVSARIDNANILFLHPQEAESLRVFYHTALYPHAQKPRPIENIDAHLLVPCFDNIRRALRIDSKLNNFEMMENLSLLKQARVLHTQHAFDASLLIGWAALETLVDMAFFCFELVEGKEQPIENKKNIQLAKDKLKISNGQFRKMGISDKVNTLCAHKLIPNLHPYLFEEVKLARNALMHDSTPTSPNVSGNVSTMARDFYDGVFGLIVKPEGGYTMRL